MTDKRLTYWKRKAYREHLPSNFGIYAWNLEKSSGKYYASTLLKYIFKWGQEWALKNYDKGIERGQEQVRTIQKKVEEHCDHNWIPVTRGMYFGAVPWRCTKCGETRKSNPNIKNGVVRV